MTVQNATCVFFTPRLAAEYRHDATAAQTGYAGTAVGDRKSKTNTRRQAENVTGIMAR